jgi:hypothetical protein
MAWFLAAGLWVVVAVNLWRIRSPRAERALLWAAAWAAVALTLNIDSIHVRFDRLAQRPNLASLIEHLAEVVAVAFMIRLFGALAEATPSPARKRVIDSVTVMTLIALTALFFSSKVPVESVHFAADYGHLPSVALFWVISLAYLVWVAARLLVIVAQHRNQVRNAVSVAFVIVRLGSVLLILFAIVKMIVVFDRNVTGPIRDIAGALDGPLLSLTIVAYIFGLAMPSISIGGNRVGRAVEDYVLLQQLRPMWRTLTAAVPNARMDTTQRLRWTELLPDRPHMRLIDRVVEIRDAQLVLLAYVLAEDMVGATDVEREGAWTVLALSKRAEGLPAGTGGLEFAAGYDSITEDARYLVEVWRAMGSSHSGGTKPRSARLVSTLFAPQLVATAVSLTGGLVAGRGLVAGLGWGLMSAVAAPLLPGAVVSLARKRLHRAVREDRPTMARVVPLICASVVALVGAGLLWGLGAPRLTVATACAMAAGVLCLMVARAWTNVSAHVSIAAAAVTFSAIVLSPWWLLAAVIPVLVAQSRLALRAHTMSQVLVAAPLGVFACSVPLVCAGYWMNS